MDYARVRKKPFPEASSLEELLFLGRRCKREQTRALFYYATLSGCRIGEIIGGRNPKFPHPPQFKNQLRKLDTRQGKVIVLTTLTEKNRAFPMRKIPIAELRDPIEAEMWGDVENWLEKNEEKKLFFLRYQDVYREFRKMKIKTTCYDFTKKTLEEKIYRVKAHYLRHCRLTDLVIRKGYDPMKLTYYAGWSNPIVAMTYFQPKVEDLVSTGGLRNVIKIPSSDRSYAWGNNRAPTSL